MHSGTVIHLLSVMMLHSDLVVATHLVLDLVEVISMYVYLHSFAVKHSESVVMIHSDLVVVMCLVLDSTVMTCV
jgi:hypothetical protein